MQDVSPWQAIAADGVSPSVELAIALDGAHLRAGSRPANGRVTATTAALDHVLRRAVSPAIDLSGSDDVRVTLNSSRPADGRIANPFFFELRLGSAALGLHASGNTWSRQVPIARTGMWETVRFSLSDLPAAVRGALNAIELRCVDASAPLVLNIDGITAVRDEMVGDIDAALRTRLDGGLVLSGSPVPAVLHPASGAITQGRPYMEITNYDIVFARERTQPTHPRGDYADGGYSLRPSSNAYDIYYQVTAVADHRAEQSRMLEFILRSLPPSGELLVNDLPLQIDSVVVNPIDQLGGFRSDAIPLFYRVQARQEVGVRERVPGAKNIVIDGDVR